MTVGGGGGGRRGAGIRDARRLAKITASGAPRSRITCITRTRPLCFRLLRQIDSSRPASHSSCGISFGWRSPGCRCVVCIVGRWPGRSRVSCCTAFCLAGGFLPGMFVGVYVVGVSGQARAGCRSGPRGSRSPPSDRRRAPPLAATGEADGRRLSVQQTSMGYVMLCYERMLCYVMLVHTPR